jgi:hypothetical protein
VSPDANPLHPWKMKALIDRPPTVERAKRYVKRREAGKEF